MWSPHLAPCAPRGTLLKCARTSVAHTIALLAACWLQSIAVPSWTYRKPKALAQRSAPQQQRERGRSPGRRGLGHTGRQGSRMQRTSAAAQAPWRGAGRAAVGTRVQVVNNFWSAPQQQHERDGGLGQRKLVADAFAHAAAEGDERKVGRDLVRVQAGALRLGPVARPRAAEVRVGVCLSKPLRPERVGVAPQVRRPARAALACYRVATGGGVWEDLGRTGK